MNRARLAPSEPAFIQHLQQILGAPGLVTGAAVRARMSNGIPPQPLQAEVLARPASTDEVAAVLRACHDRGVAVVPQGGLSGLAHGADAQPAELCLSLERMRRIEAVDPVQRVLVAEAGVTLEEAQQAAAEAGLMLPIDLGARGSATLGGVVSTNAGGNQVLRYGMTRESVLGLEAVLADGSVISSLNQLIKNNAGYDLKQLFIGSEGTLGVVTRVVLRLRERPEARQVALLALPSFEAVMQLLRRLERGTGGCVAAFEVMWPAFYRLVTTAPALGRPPLAQEHPFYVLTEMAAPGGTAGAELVTQLLGEAMEDGLVSDATLAQSEREAQALWALRDDVAQLGRHGPPAAYDLSLPLAATAAYVEQASADIQRRWPDAQVFAFGHLGDGNVHLIVQVPGLDDRGRDALDHLVYGPLAGLGGSVSAEHGIGLEKVAWLSQSRRPEELALMRTLKKSLDPGNILNPGRVLSAASGAPTA